MTTESYLLIWYVISSFYWVPPVSGPCVSVLRKREREDLAIQGLCQGEGEEDEPLQT